ncbi:MAG: hypothetical protein WBF71_02030 [Microthrixaceae bacterium]
MANLTITVDSETLKRARIRAIERGESVNAYLAQSLRQYAGESPQEDVIEAVLRLADVANAGTAGTGRNWTRDDLHRV